MGILTRYTALEVTSAGDAAALRDVLSAVGTVDGTLDPQERTVLQGFFATLPQLREEPATTPPRASRDQILRELGQLRNVRLKRQCFVLAVELAIASDGVNDAEDRWLESLRTTLQIDDAFAVATVQVMAVKYARAMED
jgi:hypothetical protein